MKEGRRIVVIGGSFNPPTLAHYKLMKVDSEWKTTTRECLWHVPAGTKNAYT